MKRISLFLASLVVLLGGKASAFVGGPFDNGDYSSLLDNSGIYQVAFRFSNGSGFASFGNNVDTELFLANSNNATTATAPGSTFSVLSRSMFYYKGVTYLGRCTGMVDHERKTVSGITNGASDFTTTAVTVPGGGGTPVSSSLNLIFNAGLNFPCNSQFLCKITNSHPILKFSGDGELSIVNPSVAQVAFTAIQQVIAAAGPLPANQTPGSQIQAIINAVNTPGIENTIPSSNQVGKNADRVKMKVFGSRIWHVSRR